MSYLKVPHNERKFLFSWQKNNDVKQEIPFIETWFSTERYFYTHVKQSILETMPPAEKNTLTLN